jgi:hypothetical protein
MPNKQVEFIPNGDKVVIKMTTTYYNRYSPKEKSQFTVSRAHFDRVLKGMGYAQTLTTASPSLADASDTAAMAMIYSSLVNGGRTEYGDRLFNAVQAKLLGRLGLPRS